MYQVSDKREKGKVTPSPMTVLSGFSVLALVSVFSQTAATKQQDDSNVCYLLQVYTFTQYFFFFI